MTRGRIRILIAATALCVLTFAAIESANADSIYLKNGRIIRTGAARIEGERVVFTQYGSNQAIPLSVVERVVDDDRTGRAAAPHRPVASSHGRAPFATPTSGPAVGPPAGRLQALSEFLGSGNGGPIDPLQALGLLQTLGSLQGKPALGADPESLGAELASLGRNLGPIGSDLEKAQTLLPLLSQLGEALFASEYSGEATTAAVEELLVGLAEFGVTPARIQAEAQRLGLRPTGSGSSPGPGAR